MSAFSGWIESVGQLGAARLVSLVVALGLGVGGIWTLVAWGTAPAYVSLIRDVPVEVIGESVRALDEGGILYEVTRGGSEIQVLEADLAKARVTLAQQGLPQQGRPGFEIFDTPSWGQTDFAQRVNYRRALEGELERTIGQMRGVSSATVHLAMAEGSVYKSKDEEVEASVLLRLTAGGRPPRETVEAITSILASAVDGLSTENVTVADDVGRVLSAANEPGMGGQADRRRLAMQQEIEGYLESQAEDMVVSLVGAHNVNVTVSALLDFEQVERTTESVDPEQQVLLWEEREEIEPGDPSQGAASSIIKNAFEGTRSVEVSTRAPGAIQRITVAVLLNQDSLNSPAAVLIPQVEDVVSKAVGLDPSRGDAISVVAVPFETPPAPPASTQPEAPPAWLELLREFQRPLVAALALIFTFFLAFRGMKIVRSAPTFPGALEPGGQEPALAGVDHAAMAAGDTPRMEAYVPDTPVDASRVVRAWLSEG